VTTTVVETHTSTLFFVDDLVYKRKKPLDLGFCDFRTRASRRAACHEEVRLNRRLAPDVYLGVADVLGPDGAPCDHLVVMRRLPADRRLSHLIERAEDVHAALRQVAEQLAGLHLRSPAPAGLARVGDAASWLQLWSDGLDALRAFPDLVPDDMRERTRELAMRWLDGRSHLLDGRIAQGRMHDGHGDLLADDIFVLPEGPQILDCLEFDERLRVGDGLADAAFLAMDLERLGAPDLARFFLSTYEDLTGDTAPASLEDLYLGYRAHVRSKVTSVRARQDGLPETAALARSLAGLALAHLERGRVRLVVVGGLPGTGKTTLAARVAQQEGWVHLSSDVTRKRLAGLAPGGLYAPDATARTYRELLDQARALLADGESVVLDASFVAEQWREAARATARDTHADVVELQCRAPEHVAEARLVSRPAGPSDATAEVRRAMSTRLAPWPEALRIDTSGSVEESSRQVAAGVGLPPSEATPIGDPTPRLTPLRGSRPAYA
jgi:aminoglycoside phosphotransferase family enzyme/predicted kinase